MNFCTSINKESTMLSALSSFARSSWAPDGEPVLNRRQMLRRVGGGFGSVALAGLLAEETRGTGPFTPKSVNRLAVKAPHFTPRAKQVIFLFMPGGPSQVDTFDPKPRLTKDHGKPSPKLYLGQRRNLLASPWKFQRHGRAGIE